MARAVSSDLEARMGTTALMRFRLRMKLEEIRADDLVRLLSASANHALLTPCLA